MTSLKDALKEIGRLNKSCIKNDGISYRYSNNSEDAKDILQKGFVKVYSNLKKYNFTGSLEGWIRRRIVNTASY